MVNRTANDRGDTQSFHPLVPSASSPHIQRALEIGRHVTSAVMGPEGVTDQDRLLDYSVRCSEVWEAYLQQNSSLRISPRSM
jgi:hypothetical protein